MALKTFILSLQRISVCLSLITLFFISLTGTAQEKKLDRKLETSSIDCPPNINFEEGTFNHWSLDTGFVRGLEYVDPISGSSITCPYGPSSTGLNQIISGPSIALEDRHKIIPNSGGLDPYGGFPINPPDGSNYAIKLGSDINDAYFATLTGNAAPGSKAERATFLINVPVGVTDYSITYQYAVVFEDPGHVPENQPRFTVNLTDANTGESVPCGFVEYIAESTIPGFFESSPGSNIYCKSWTPVFINLAKYAGRTLNLEFTTSDCAQGGHWGYAYLDVNECKLAVSANISCQNPPQTSLIGPPGFMEYKWWKSDFSQILANDSITFIPALQLNETIFLELIPFSGAVCRDTLEVKVTKDSLAIGNLPDKEVCSGIGTSIGSSTPLSDCIYTWTSDAVSGIPSNPLVQVQPANTANFYLMVTNTLTNCKAYDTVSVIVDTGPHAEIQPDTSEICSGAAIQFQNQSDLGMAYQWSPISPITWTNNTSQYVPGPTSPLIIQGNYQFELKVTNPLNGCESFDTAYVFVNPKPQAGWSITPIEGCDSLKITIDDLSQFSDSSRVWFDNGTVLNLPKLNNQVTIKLFQPDTLNAFLVAYSNCIPDTSNSVTIKVRKSPEADFYSSTTGVSVWPTDTVSICAGEQVTFTNLFPGIPGIEHEWNFGDGFLVSVQESPSHIYNLPGLFEVTLRENYSASPFCPKFARKWVLVKPPAIAQFSGPSVSCEGSLVTFQNSSQNSSFFKWFLLQGGNVIDSVENISAWTIPPTQPGNYQIRIKVEGLIQGNGCSDEIENQFEILARPQVSFAIPQQSICLSDSLKIINSSQSGMNYYWFIGGSNIPFSTSYFPPANPVNISGQVLVKLRAQNPLSGCSSTDSAMIFVSSGRRTKANFQVIPPLEGCDTLRVLFINKSIDADSASVFIGYNNLQLPISGGLNSNISYTYPDTGKFETKIIAKGLCNRDTSEGPSIRIWPSPKVGFYASTLLQPTWITDTIVICVNDTVRFHNSLPLQSGVHYRWKFSESGTIFNGINPDRRNYLNSGYYAVTLQAISDSGSCLVEERKIVRVKPLPTVSLNISPSSVCAGSEVVLDGTNTQNAEFFRWEITEGNFVTTIDTAAPFIHYTFSQTGNGNTSIRLIAYNSASRNSCFSEITKSVVVRPKPIPSITLNDSLGCSPLTITFSRNPENFGGQESVFCNFDNNQTSNSADLSLTPLIFTNPDIIEEIRIIKLKVAFQGCVDSSTRKVRIFPVPKPGLPFVNGFGPIIHQANPVLKMQEEVTPVCNQWVRYYDFGDGKDTIIIGGPNIQFEHRYDTTGTYTVTQKVMDWRYPDSCSTILEQNFISVIQSLPRADFKVNGNDSCSICEDDTVTFSNKSRFVTQSSFWNFGNGKTLRVTGNNRNESQKIVYPDPGVYQVSLIVKNEKGMDTVVKKASVIVNPKPNTAFTISPNIFEYPIFKDSDPIQTVNATTGGTRFFWNFGEFPDDTLQAFDTTYRFTIPGAYTISLVSISELGCPDTFRLQPTLNAFMAGLWVPDAFSPNGDGLNDDWQIFHINVNSFQLFVYNQWGEQIFYSADPEKRWNGTYEGAYCPNGGYSFQITYTLNGLKGQVSAPRTISKVVTIKR